MDIGIIGAGNVGTGIGKRLAAKGHQILVSFARSQDKLDAAAQAIGRGARPGSPTEAARFGEAVILASRWKPCRGWRRRWPARWCGTRPTRSSPT